jgi:hypothetical protein
MRFELDTWRLEARSVTARPNLLRVQPCSVVHIYRSFGGTCCLLVGRRTLKMEIVGCCRMVNILHGVMSQKKVMCTVTAVETSDLILESFLVISAHGNKLWTP